MSSGATALFDPTEDHPVRLVRIIDLLEELLGRAVDPVDRRCRANLDAAGVEYVEREPTHDLRGDRLDPEADRQEGSGATDDLVIGRQPAGRLLPGWRGLESGSEVEQWVEPVPVAAEELDSITVGDERRHSGSIRGVGRGGKRTVDD